MKLSPEGWFLAVFAGLFVIVMIWANKLPRIWDAIDGLVYFIIVVLAIIGAYHLWEQTKKEQDKEEPEPGEEREDQD